LINFSDFVKTYDVRGLVGVQLTNEIIECFGAGFVDELELCGKELVIGHDMRDSSSEFAQSFAKGAIARGANPVLIGLCSTDMTYYASGALGLAAVMFTASHNPSSYNGMKFSRAFAKGISLDTGLAKISQRAQDFLAHGIGAVSELGSMREQDVIADYAKFLRELVDLSGMRPLKIVVDAANGMAGLTVPAVLGDSAGLSSLPIELVELYFELDGSFPNHEANPLDPKNLMDLQRAVVENGADLGLAFDGDADRCFAVDELGGLVNPSALAAIVSKREIRRVRAQGEDDVTVLHNLLTSNYVAEVIAKEGATPIRTRVGHSLIKDQMALTNAVFGGEHSAHYYFRDFFGADNGMLAALHLINELAEAKLEMSELANSYTPYFSSGEINSTVTDGPAALSRVLTCFPEASVENFDGMTISVSGKNWFWLNVRFSNTEPLLRLNVESNQEILMIQIRDMALGAIRET
jgi:phosphomannomutase